MRKQPLKFYCFSPPVMVGTFLIEFGLFVYTLVRHRMNESVRLIATLLLFLSIFQLSEYNVCTDSSTMQVWSRIGYMAITLLPALAIHLIFTIAQRKTQWLVWSSYAVGIGIAMFFGFSKTAFSGHICTGNYVIFQLADSAGGIFFAYYYALLFIGLFSALFFSIRAKQNIREALVLQAIGYLSFLLPTGVVNTINPQSIQGLPSIMCGFAIMYALILGFGIAPLLAKDSHKK